MHAMEEEVDFRGLEELRALGMHDLQCILKDLKTESQRYSQTLVHLLVDRDRVMRRREEWMARMSDVLVRYADRNQLDRNIKFNLTFTDYYNDREYKKWINSWSVVSQLNKGILRQWRRKVWEGVALYNTRQISWEKVLPYLTHDRTNKRDIEWKQEIVKSVEQLGSRDIDLGAIERILIAYSRLFPAVIFCPEFCLIASIAMRLMEDETLALKVVVCILEYKISPNYFCGGLHTVKLDILVLGDLIKHFIPELSSHMEAIRSSSSSHISKAYSSEKPPRLMDSTTYEPPLFNALSLQWLMSLFTSCLPWKSIRRIFDAVMINDSDMFLYAALAIWTIMERDLLMVHTVPDFYTRALELVEQLKTGNLISTEDFIQIMYTLRQCGSEKHDKIIISDLRKNYTTKKKNPQTRSSPICPPPSQGGNLLLTSIVPPPRNIISSTSTGNVSSTLPTASLTALAVCPQTKKTGFVFAYSYGADVPSGMLNGYALKLTSNCTNLLKNGKFFKIGGESADDPSELFSTH